MKPILGFVVSAVLALAGCAGGGTDDPAAAAGAEAAATAPTWPTATATVSVSATQKITGTFDGGMKRYVGAGALGTGTQSESQPAMFQLADGATLSNVIIGYPAADGVHCLGTCTLKNVWWEDVGEDAATMEASSKGAMTIDGGGARLASDKIFQHNGSGLMTIRNFYAEDFGKLYRSCGNCTGAYQGQRHAVIQNVVVTKVNTAIAGINSNYGDTADMSGITVLNDTTHKTVICVRYQGNNTGAEPTKLGTGPGSGCNYDPAAIAWGPTTTPTTYGLTVTRAGSGGGTVTSSSGGISCGSTCSATYTSGTAVTLTASPASGSTFGGWSGSCSGTGTTCTLSMTAARSVTATFNGSTPPSTYTLTVAKAGTGNGTVTSSSGGISCGSTCSATYASGASVTLTAAPASGSTFGGWSGSCSGTGATCTVSMSAARSVTATFTASGSGTGGPCANAVTVTGGNSGNFNTTGAACYRTNATINGWGCFNMDGRTVAVNGTATTCGSMPVSKWTDGYTYFAFGAGTYAWAGFYYW